MRSRIPEIFAEEMDEEIQRLRGGFPLWASDVANRQALTSIRRAFHTIKGSSRLIGAQVIGEFAWNHEHLLNSVMEGSLDAHPALVAYVHDGIALLPALRTQLLARERPDAATVAHITRIEAVENPAIGALAPDTSHTPATEVIHFQAEMIEAEPDDGLLTAEVEASPVVEIEMGDRLSWRAAQSHEPPGGDTDANEAEPLSAEIIASSDNELVGTPAIQSGAGAIMPESDAHQEASLDSDFAMPDWSLDDLDRLLESLDEPDGALSEFASAESAVEEESPEITEPAPPLMEAPTAALRRDAVLLDIFAAEAAEHFAQIRRSCALGGGPMQVDEPLLRATHTLNGAARTAGIPEIYEAARGFERLLTIKHRRGQAIDSEEIALVLDFVAHGERVLDAMRRSEPLPDAAELRSQIGRTVEFLERESHLDVSVAAIDVEPAGEAIARASDAIEETSSAANAADVVTVSRADEALETANPESAAIADDAGAARFAAGVEADRQAAVDEGSAAPARGWADDGAGEHSAELVEVFLDECREILDNCDNTMARWEANPEDSAPVAELRRELHTLKGGARMAGVQVLGDLSHALEYVFLDVVEGRLTADRELFDLINTSLDQISQMAALVQAHKPVTDNPTLLEQLARVRRGESVAAHELARAEIRRGSGVSKPGAALASGSQTRSAPPSDTQMTDRSLVEERSEGVAAEVAAAKDVVKIRADLLDKMVDNIGEVNVFQSRVEQQVSGFGFNLQELEQTVKRLGAQLRRLEVETEAQIVHRYDAKIDPDESSVYDKFDPLELDRYSTMQQLARGLAESSNDLTNIHQILTEQIRTLETLLRQQSRVNGDLQEGLMQTRMLQFRVMVPRLRRVVRRAAMELGKEVELQVAGEQQTLDRKMLEGIVVPLEHMLRNAVAHGIELPEQRVQAGKSRVGRIQITIAREGPEIVIAVTDDGAGIGVESVRRKAVTLGLIDGAQEFTDAEIMELILRPGFSTAERVSQLAGRGVGMDVVQEQVRRMNGVLDIQSTAGQGTRFRIHLPFTLAINQALLISVGADTFAVPLNMIESVIQAPAKVLAEQFSKPLPTIDYAGVTYLLKPVASVLERNPNSPLPHFERTMPLLLVRTQERAVAFLVDHLLGNREIVVKSVGTLLQSVKGISGATILGDGRVVLILDMVGLLRAATGEESWAVVRSSAVASSAPSRPTIMVVDDSITIRKVTARMLERHNYNVVTAKDGVDAIAQLQDLRPDLMLLDIEMPRMDGYELAAHLRNTETSRDLPIIMITSRTGKKHRDRALELGVNRFLGKPYQDQVLIENIQAVFKETRQQVHGSAAR